MSRLVDLSHHLEPGMPSYPGVPAPRFHTLVTHAESVSRGLYAAGTSFQIAAYDLAGNTGTYLDAPFHRHEQGPDLAQLELGRVADLSGIVIPAPRDGPIDPSVFAGARLAGAAVLVHTRWADRWDTEGYFRSGPFLTADSCRLLVETEAALVAIDCANIDDMNDGTRPAHTILLGAGIPIVEHLRGVDALPSGGFRFFAVPPAIAAGTSFPVRAFAIVD